MRRVGRVSGRCPLYSSKQGAAQLLRQFAHVFTERGYYGRRVLARTLRSIAMRISASARVRFGLYASSS